MFGIWSEYAQTYLLALSIVVTLVFALPAFFVPMTWARIFMWKIPEDTDLAVYFGRCCAAFILLLVVFALRAALTGEGLVWIFEYLVLLFALMVIVHLYGWFRKIQPLTETIEIGVYTGLLILTFMFFPVPGP